MVLTILLGLCVMLLSAVVFYLFFWLDMLVDATNHPFSSNKEKYIWLAVISLTFIGAILYYYQIKKLSPRT